MVLFIYFSPQNRQNLHVAPSLVSCPTSSALHRHQKWARCIFLRSCSREWLPGALAESQTWCSAAAMSSDKQILQRGKACSLHARTDARHAVPGIGLICLIVIVIAPDSQTAVAFHVEPLLSKHDLSQDWKLARRGVNRPFPPLRDGKRCVMKLHSEILHTNCLLESLWIPRPVCFT